MSNTASPPRPRARSGPPHDKRRRVDQHQQRVNADGSSASIAYEVRQAGAATARDQRARHRADARGREQPAVHLGAAEVVVRDHGQQHEPRRDGEHQVQGGHTHDEGEPRPVGRQSRRPSRRSSRIDGSSTPDLPPRLADRQERREG